MQIGTTFLLYEIEFSYKSCSCQIGYFLHLHKYYYLYSVFSGVDIQLVEPGQVNTKMAELFAEKLTWAVPTPSTFVQSAITKLGFSARTCGYWAHSFQYWFLFQFLLPEWALAAATLKQGKKQYRQSMEIKKGD